MSRLFRYNVVQTALVLLSSFVVLCIADALKFYAIASGTYKTPWYDSRFIFDPYTHIRLSLLPSAKNITTNANHTEEWLVKETKYGDKEFWTILRRRRIGE